MPPTKFIFSILFLFILGMAHSQDSTWKRVKIDDLSVLMPVSIVRTDTSFRNEKGKLLKTSTVKVNGDEYYLGVTVTNETGLHADNTESMDKALADVGKGFCEKAEKSGFRCQLTDTIINEFHGKKGLLTAEAMESLSVINYLFLVNDKLYMLTASFSNADNKAGNEMTLNKFISSVSFPTGTKEKQFKSKTESVAYKIGQVAFYLVLAGVIFFIIMVIKGKNSRKTDSAL